MDNGSSLIPLPPIEANYLDGLEVQHRREIARERARRLPRLRRYYYRLAMWARLGNLNAIYAALRSDHIATEYERREAAMLKALIPEAKLFGRLLQHRLAMLGFSDVERQEGQRRLRKTVRFRLPIYITPERIYYQVLVSSQKLLGSRSELPYRSSATKLVDDETVQDLSMILDRRVQAVYRPHKGTWYIVHRTQDTTGIPPLVRFSDMMPYFGPGRADVCLGVSEFRRVEMARIGSVPHTLIGGSTLSGKSVFLNNLISGIIRNNTPAQVKLLLIDLKMVEFFDYFKMSPAGEFLPAQSIPHLVGPVVTEPNDALDTLKRVHALVKQRYAIMAGQFRNIDEYNRTYHGDNKMPRLIVVIDEVGELSLDTNTKRSQDVIRILLRIAQLGRAAGVHLVLSTQRPEKQIISPNIRAQCDLAVSFRMKHQWDSMTILGTGHAANLPDIPGRACYRLGPNVVEIQAPLIDTARIMESIGLAMEMPRRELDLPSLAAADALLNDDNEQLLDYEAALTKLLLEAEGHLGVHTIMDILNLKQSEASLFQRRVAGLTIDHNGQTYQANKSGKTYRLENVARVRAGALKYLSEVK